MLRLCEQMHVFTLHAEGRNPAVHFEDRAAIYSHISLVFGIRQQNAVTYEAGMFKYSPTSNSLTGYKQNDAKL